MNPDVLATTGAGDGDAARPISAVGEHTSTVVTRMQLAALPGRVWDGLSFYEQIDELPPLHLRWLLPLPIRTEGWKPELGGEVRCLYESGHLVKRVTRIDRGRGYGFRIVEQQLEFGGGVKLCGGAYELRELPGGGTEVALETRYVSPRRPRWFWRRIEAAVCHAFHRHILRALRLAVESSMTAPTATRVRR